MAFIQYYVSRDGFFFSAKKKCWKKKNVSRDGKGFCVHATSAKSCIPFFLFFFKSNLSIGFDVASKGLTSRLHIAHCLLP